MGSETLADWLCEELTSWPYKVPSETAQSWVKAGGIVPLLDGLDEVADEARIACVQAINKYDQERGAAPLVVCCRTNEYKALRTRVNLHLYQAVDIWRLKWYQIDPYLQRAEGLSKGQLEALRQAVLGDNDLYELMRQPLMLRIFTLAYRDKMPQDLRARGTRKTLQREVFDDYVEQMLKRRAPRQFSCEQIRHWLTFLATRMQQNNQTRFHPEDLQLGWVTDRWLERLSLSIVSIGLIFGLFSILSITHALSVVPSSLLSSYEKYLRGLCTFGLSTLRGPGPRRDNQFFTPFLLLLALLPIIPLTIWLGSFILRFCLRVWLWCIGSLPWNLVAFLEKAAEQLLLRKVPGGYEFIHLQLRDYFASLEKKES